MSTSSAHELHQLLRAPYGSTAAPPPTPSAQSNLLSSSEAADTLSRLLHRLPPTLSLSLPSRRPSISSVYPPVISFTDSTSSLSSDILSASQLGFFLLVNHSVPSQLALSAEAEALSLKNLSSDEKQLHFPKNWPLGFDADDDDDESNTVGGSFCLDSACSTKSTELNLSSLREFAREMEKIGLEVIEALSSAAGFDNPVKEDPSRFCSLMWISEGSTCNKTVSLGRFYPFIVGLQYQIRCQKYSMLSDSGWVSASPQIDSIIVTLGDIAQVWSNGKLNKVRGRPAPCSVDVDDCARCITISVLLTLPMDSIVSPRVPKSVAAGDGIESRPANEMEEEEKEEKEEKEESTSSSNSTAAREEWAFNAFSFEDYAWRVYHERLTNKDPLVRYRV